MDEEKKDVVDDEVTDSEEDSSEEEHKGGREKPSKDYTLTDKVRENPWIVATLVLGVVVVVLLFQLGVFSGGSSTTGAFGAVENPDVVTSKVLEFVNSQVDEPVEVVSTSMKNGLYEVVINYQEREIPLYVTADGQNLVQGVTPFDQLMQAAAAQDAQASQPTEVPKTDKPVVDLFVMSMCPYGTQAEKGILPVLMKLGDKIDFNLRFVSYAMHGKAEVDENTVQYCIQKNEPAKFYSYLECYLGDSDPASWEACRKEVGINEAQLKNCITATDTEFKITELFNDKSTWSGGRYPQYNTDKDSNTQYGVQGSPTLIINGVQSTAGRSSSSYLAGICAAFNVAPEECNTVFPAETPAPGFGWDTTASDTVAQCG